MTIIAGAGVATDLLHTQRHGQIDLRNRVTGARLLLLGKNPYQYSWTARDPVELLDPVPFQIGENDQPRTLAVTRTTATPTVLAFHAMFASIAYPIQKYFWLMIEWGLYAGMVMMVAGTARTQPARGVVLALGAAWFCTFFWRLHIERGQVYILYAFLAAAVVLLTLGTHRVANFLGGVLLGLLLCMRPPCVFLGMPLLLHRRYVAIAGSIVGALIGIGAPLIMSPTVWGDYRDSMQRHAGLATSVGETALQTKLPESIEGVPISQMRSVGLWYNDTSSIKPLVAKAWGDDVAGKVSFGLLGMLVVCFLISSWLQFRRGAPLGLCSTQALGWTVAAEIVLPTIRGSYSDVWLVPIVLLAFVQMPWPPPVLQRSLPMASLLIGLLLASGFNWLPYSLAPRLPAFAILLFVWSLRDTDFLKESDEASADLEDAERQRIEAT